MIIIASVSRTSMSLTTIRWVVLPAK